MTDDQKLEFGIEIVSAMKASAYDMPIEDGRILALQGTEIDRIEDFAFEDFDSLPDDKKEFYKKWASREKEILHEQAMFVAGIAIEKLHSMNIKS